jgi:superfamily II DNA or RNA helicase
VSRLILESPTRLRLPKDAPVALLRSTLSFVDKAAHFEAQRFKKAQWFKNKFGEEAFQEKLEEMKARVNVCLLFEDEQGYYTHSGLAGRLQASHRWSLDNQVVYPEPELVPYAHKPEYEPRYYQVDGVEALLKARHGAVEIGTGLGKSVMIEMLCKRLGVPTLIMAPSRSIAGQLYRQLLHRFGPRYVGFYGDGKKKFDKLFTVGIAASLTRIEPGSPAWRSLSRVQCFIADESHLCPADTLASVCMQLAAQAPYRFFFSGTQLRADGSGLLLDGITGPIVYRLSVREGVDQGFLSKPHFYMHRVASHSTFRGREHMEMMQMHFWGNPELHAYAADLANKSVGLLRHQVLVLVEHVDQFQHLLPHLRHEVGFAHGGLNKDNRGYVPQEFHDSDVDALVERFNKGELPILIGTSCITTGTDIQTARTVINLQGGQSEVKVRQAIGRGTRRRPDKVEFNYHDFFVRPPDVVRGDDEEGERYSGLTTIERHALNRRDIFDGVYGPTKWVGKSL